MQIDNYNVIIRIQYQYSHHSEILTFTIRLKASTTSFQPPEGISYCNNISSDDCALNVTFSQAIEEE